MNPAAKPAAIVVADFNADGKSDVAVADQSRGLLVFLGNGDGTFQIPVGYGSTDGSPTAVAVGDFNADGKPDLAVANLGRANVSLFLGKGDGTFPAPVSYPTGSQPTSVVVGDFNGDSRPDLATANQGANSLSILLGTAAVAPFVGIEAPTSGGLIGGVTTVSGWAMDNPLSGATPIGSIVVKVDGFVGNATIGAPRGDICILYSNLNNCPGVAYSYQLDTRGLGLGNHTITVSATDTETVPQTGSASVSAVVLPGLPPTVAIDSPLAGSVVPNQLTITGWAIDNTTFIGSAIDSNSIVVSADGAIVGTVNYGLSRPDVCTAYPGRAGCPNVGYSFMLNTSSLGTGSHTITVSAANTNTLRVVGSASVSVTVSNIPPLLAIDSPMASSVLSGTATISGWAIDNGTVVGTAISSVQVLVDFAVVGNATYGTNRADVCSVYPGRLGCPNVGYSYALNTSNLTAGPHLITVSATDSDGNADMASKSVFVTVASGPPDVFIENPTAGAVLSGTATVTGWAIDSAASIGTPITSVVVKVDGAVVGNAFYGVSRPDVCATFPGRPNCPNVGFAYALDTTRLTPGSHMLSVVATDSDGIPDSGTWTVAFQVGMPPTVFIDSLAPGATISGPVTVSGWAIDSVAAMSNVQIKVDGGAVGNATYGTARPDVCIAFPGRPGCPNVGFTFQLNTTSLRSGTHMITALATDAEGTPVSGSYTLTVNVPLTAPPPIVYVDSLAPGSAVVGTVTVSGWAIDEFHAIEGVQVFVDETLIGAATYGTARPDVCAAFPGRPGCPNVGFTYQLNTALLTAGTHKITISANLVDRPDIGLYSFPITVILTPPPTVYVDSPAAGATISGTVTISGWAIDSGTPIVSMQVFVDGGTVGMPTYGVARPDVCAAFPGRPGCPNVGFTYQLNTASLTPGLHGITVVATDSDAAPESGSYSLTVRK